MGQCIWFWEFFIEIPLVLTLMLLVDNLAIRKSCKKPEKLPKTLTHGYSSERNPQELSNECQHDRV